MTFLKQYWKWIALLLGVIAISFAASFLPLKDWMKVLTDTARAHGALGVAVYIAAYAVATVLFLPGWIFTVSAGLIYGILGGTAVALVGATLGASLAFLVARYLVRGRVERAARGNKKFEAIDEAVGKNGWKIIALLRLSPLIPFNVSNYLYGVTRIGFWPYLLSSLVGMLPGTLLYAYLGAAGGAGLGDGKTHHSPLQYILLGVGLVATITVTVLISRMAKAALKRSGAAESDGRGAERPNATPPSVERPD
jgi:uncharacterized membrane protein YdjX (TVP38/TMEM64 family)